MQRRQYNIVFHSYSLKLDDSDSEIHLFPWSRQKPLVFLTFGALLAHSHPIITPR